MERSVNQDYYGYYEPEDDAEYARRGRLIVVCDGMGGHAGGEVASQLAVNTIINSYRQSSGDVGQALKAAIEEANRAIWDKATAESGLKGMGTTAVGIVLKDGLFYAAHVGDSRCYLVRDNQLHHVTLDHSLVQQMVNEGLLRPEDMENHPEKNVILRSLGVKPEVEVELQPPQPFQVDDIFLLSSDGLTGLVSDQECFQVAMMQRDNPMQACAQLIDLANKYGGYDNITVQMVRIMAMTVEEAIAKGYDQVKQQIADARSVMEAPSQSEMASNTEGKAKGEQTNVTGVVDADEIAKIKEQIAEQKKAQGAKKGGGAKAAKAGGGGGFGVGPLVGAGVLAAAVGLFGGVAMTGKVTDLKAEVAGLRQKAESAFGKDSEKYKAVATKADAASQDASSLIGRFRGAAGLTKVKRELQLLLQNASVGGSANGGSFAGLAEVKAFMESARTAATTARAGEQATALWGQAENLMREGDAADDETSKAHAYMRAAVKFTEATKQAGVVAAGESFKANKAIVKTLQDKAEALSVVEHFPVLSKSASDALSAAEASSTAGDAYEALSKQGLAIEFLRAAVAAAKNRRGS
jgi:protein phosphatase